MRPDIQKGLQSMTLQDLSRLSAKVDKRIESLKEQASDQAKSRARSQMIAAAKRAGIPEDEFVALFG